MGTGGRPGYSGGRYSAPPGGWTHYYAEQFVEDKKERRHEEDKKVKGKWVIISTHRVGKIASQKMSYADAIKKVEEMKESNIKIASKFKNLGPFQPTYEIERATRGFRQVINVIMKTTNKLLHIDRQTDGGE